MEVATQTKKCFKCGHTKPLSDFTKNKGTKTGLDYYCKACKASWWANKMSIPANREARNEYVRNWRRQNLPVKNSELIKIIEQAIGQMNRIGHELNWSDPIDEGYVHVLDEMREAVNREAKEQ